MHICEKNAPTFAFLPEASASTKKLGQNNTA